MFHVGCREVLPAKQGMPTDPYAACNPGELSHPVYRSLCTPFMVEPSLSGAYAPSLHNTAGQFAQKPGLKAVRSAEVTPGALCPQEGYGGKISFVRPSGAQEDTPSSQQNGVSPDPNGSASPEPAGDPGPCAMCRAAL